MKQAISHKTLLMALKLKLLIKYTISNRYKKSLNKTQIRYNKLFHNSEKKISKIYNIEILR